MFYKIVSWVGQYVERFMLKQYPQVQGSMLMMYTMGPTIMHQRVSHTISKPTIIIISNTINFKFPSRNVCPRALDYVVKLIQTRASQPSAHVYTKYNLVRFKGYIDFYKFMVWPLSYLHATLYYLLAWLMHIPPLCMWYKSRMVGYKWVWGLVCKWIGRSQEYLKKVQFKNMHGTMSTCRIQNIMKIEQ